MVECNLAKIKVEGSNPFIYFDKFKDKWSSGLRR